MNKVSKIISGFPGVGKSSLFRKYGEEKVSDSDSSMFPKDKFPANYLNHIKMLVASGKKYVLVSSHAEVRAGLVECNIPFQLVYPSVELKEEYLQRYRDRGSSEEFVTMMGENWEMFIAQCQEQTGCEHIVLKAGQFLVDVI